MFKIRQSQMDAFEAHLWERYIDTLVARSIVELPQAADRVGGKSALRTLIGGAVKGAARYGLLSEADVTRFALFVAAQGRNPIEDEGPLGVAMRDLALLGAAKLDLLDALVVSHGIH